MSGCNFHCKNCFNKEYQNFEYGKPFDEDAFQHFIDLGKHKYIKGYSILGGEPFQQDAFVLYCLVREIKKQTGKSIWIWTGYNFEDIPKQYFPIVKFVDVIVDGQFIDSKKDLMLKFRGSSNQRIIDVQKTLEEKKIILFDI